MSFAGKYLDWNQKRIKGILEYYGHKFFINKKVLDLGCFHGDFGGLCLRLGSSVSAVDARQEHLQIAGKKYPGIKLIRSDLDREWKFHGIQFDLILDLGLLNHLQDPITHLKNVCASTTHLVLETAVIDSDDPYAAVIGQENKNILDNSVNGSSSRLSTKYIEHILTSNGMSFKRIDNAKFNAGNFVYDWVAKNNGDTDYYKRRIWFASKTKELEIDDSPPVVSPASIIPTNLSDSFRPINAPKTKLFIPTPIKKLKAALLICSHLRTFDQNYKSLVDNILSRMDVDIFISTFDTLGMSYRWTDGDLYKIKTENIKDQIISLYNPKKLVIEKPKEFTLTPLMKQRILEHRDVNGIISMFYKVEHCNSLRKEYEAETGVKYDVVIKFRTDIFVEEPIPISQAYDLNKLYLPAEGNYGGINDQIAWGSPEIMDKYASLYSNLEGLLKAGSYFNPEKLMQSNVERLKIPVNRVHFKYLIKRKVGLIQNNGLLERALGFTR
jgi:2-polyprenyl-3-methyl-5-hydroxy-6-metoxy-1,4-benzoquinol methylase